MKKQVRVIAGVDKVEGDNYPQYKLLPVEQLSTRRYHNTMLKLAHLSPCAHMLLNYFSETMNTENVIRNDKRTRQNFNAVLQQASQPMYSDAAIHKAVADLKEQSLLLPVHRGTMRINPQHFFKGQERSRLALIKRIFSKKA